MGKPVGKRPLGRPCHGWGITLQWIFKKWDGGHGLNLSSLGYGQVVGDSERSNEPSRSKQRGGIS